MPARKGLFFLILLSSALTMFGVGYLGGKEAYRLFFDSVVRIEYSLLDDASAKIAWRSKVPAIGSVEYGTNQMYLNVAEASHEFDYDHQVSIHGLLPRKDHFFRLIMLDKNNKSRSTAFYVLKSSGTLSLAF